MKEGDEMNRFSCATCGAPFSTRERLIAHEHWAFHGYQCLLCGVEVATRAEFDTHLVTAHPQEPSKNNLDMTY